MRGCRSARRRSRPYVRLLMLRGRHRSGWRLAEARDRITASAHAVRGGSVLARCWER